MAKVHPGYIFRVSQVNAGQHQNSNYTQSQQRPETNQFNYPAFNNPYKFPYYQRINDFNNYQYQTPLKSFNVPVQPPIAVQIPTYEAIYPHKQTPIQIRYSKRVFKKPTQPDNTHRLVVDQYIQNIKPAENQHEKLFKYERPSFKPIGVSKKQDQDIINDTSLISEAPKHVSLLSTEFKKFSKKLDKAIDDNQYGNLKDFAFEAPNKLDRAIGMQLCKYIVEKLLNSMRALDDSAFKTKDIIEKLNLISYFISIIKENYYSDEIKRWIYDLNLNILLSNPINQYLNVTDNEFSYRKRGIASVYSLLSNITFDDEQILVNKKTNFIEKAFYILDKEINFFSEKNLKDIDSIVLYEQILEFLWQFIQLSHFNKYEVVETYIADKLINEELKLKAALDSFAKNNETLQCFEIIIVLILGYIVNDDQMKNIEVLNNIVLVLLKAIERIIKQSANNKIENNTKYYLTMKNIENKAKVISLSVFLRCLLRLLANDDVKRKIDNLNGIQLILKIMRENDNVEEQVLCTQIFSALCFNSRVKNLIKNDEATMKLINIKAKNSKTRDEARSYEILKNVIDDKLEKRFESVKQKEKKNNAKEQHIMISYCHEDKRNCFKIKEILKANNYKTWIDEENMNENENIIDSMANAVENSALILMCYSEAYKTSPNCQREAQYAEKLKKTIVPLRLQSKYNPDGWLELLINEHLYFDLSNPELEINDPIIQQLLYRIKHAMHEKTNEENDKSQTNEKKIVKKENHLNEANIVSSKSITDKEKIGKWTSEDVQLWLFNQGIYNLQKPFKDFNGSSLMGLYIILKNNFLRFLEIINNLLKDSEVQISWSEKLSLVNSLENLF